MIWSEFGQQWGNFNQMFVISIFQKYEFPIHGYEDEGNVKRSP